MRVERLEDGHDNKGGEARDRGDADGVAARSGDGRDPPERRPEEEDEREHE